MYMEMEALNPKRIERISTTDFLDSSPYVPFATLRLRDLDELEKEGSLTAEEVAMVKEWRCKAFLIVEMTIFLFTMFRSCCCQAGCHVGKGREALRPSFHVCKCQFICSLFPLSRYIV